MAGQTHEWIYGNDLWPWNHNQRHSRCTQRHDRLTLRLNSAQIARLIETILLFVTLALFREFHSCATHRGLRKQTAQGWGKSSGMRWQSALP
jgi:hypothetical protein